MAATAELAGRDFRGLPRLGILGGGQLGRMLCLAAKPLGVFVAVLDPDPLCPCRDVASELVVGSFRDRRAIFELASKCDVLTVEIEHIDVAALREVAAALPALQIHPSPEALSIVQDKYLQKCTLRDAGVPVGAFVEVHCEDDLRAAARSLGLPLMLKSKRLAYDGRGNCVVSTLDGVDAAFDKLRVSGELFAEKWVPFERELAVLVARSAAPCAAGGGEELVSYAVMETVQRDSICHTVHAPAAVSAVARDRAVAVARQAVARLGGAGVFAVELFELADGSVLLNEVAPRVHNSGHLTIEACATSQFEQHVRAVLALPLGSPALRVPHAAMLNVIGAGDGDAGAEATWARAARALRVPGASLHWYCKRGCRAARKMGHVTVTGAGRAEVDAALAALQRADEATAVATGSDGGASSSSSSPLVGIIMGSDSDLPCLAAAAEVLAEFGVPFEVTIVSAHRTPQRLVQYAAGAHGRGLRVIIAAAGGAAHLPGMTAALTPLPVIGVPVALAHLDGVDSLYSIVQMPRGIPVATVAIGNATNAALLAVRMLGVAFPHLLAAMAAYQARIEGEVLHKVDRLAADGWRAYAKGMAAAKAAAAPPKA